MKVLVPTSVTLPKDLIRKIDMIRDPKEISRSGLIRLVMTRFVETEKVEKRNETSGNKKGA